MRRHVWSLPLVAVCLLASIATTAHAECAWVLWHMDKPRLATVDKDGRIGFPALPGTDWSRYAFYTTEAACWTKITEVTFVPREGSLSDGLASAPSIAPDQCL